MLLKMEFSLVLILPSAAASRLSRAFLHQFVYPACLPRCGAPHCTQQWLVHSAKRGLRLLVKWKKEMENGVLKLIISPHVHQHLFCRNVSQQKCRNKIWLRSNIMLILMHGLYWLLRLPRGSVRCSVDYACSSTGILLQNIQLTMHIKPAAVLWPFKQTFTLSIVQWVGTFVNLCALYKFDKCMKFRCALSPLAVNDELLTICTKSFWSIKLVHNESLVRRPFQLHLTPTWLHVEYWLCKAF